MISDIENGTGGFEGLAKLYRSFLPQAELELIRPREEFHWRGRFVGDGNLSVWGMVCDGDWALRPHCEADRFCVVFPSAGAIEVDIGGRRTIATPQSALISGLHKVSQMWSHGHNSRVVLKWNAAAANKILSQIFEGACLRNVGLGPQLDLSGPQGQTLQHLARALSSGLRDEQMRSAKATAVLSEATLRLIFERFPNSFAHRLERTPEAAMPKQVKDAVDFMYANLHQPLTLGGIAEAVGVSGRSLQAGFRRFLDTSPLAYLRELRLEAVHMELRRPENFLQVHEVALKWGFTHMGRFAVQYRAAFGVSPSETSRLAIRARR
ncbi:AraC family transcriptional regulator [Bradyrhizobium liaoningense]|uniref:AraC family transcriptional regulator n=1 Tax=Bradyrhizobium liaoningense TaxID=43992 RepID=UPI001BA811BD|nr:AraC family transcriptional regulator [Bradyrhizobium liaoningense]MBR0717743.1 AraC family transcriptional regulator [Bradyrhizobium liaoningense]